jgi:hypothetical protein
LVSPTNARCQWAAGILDLHGTDQLRLFGDALSMMGNQKPPAALFFEQIGDEDFEFNAPATGCFPDNGLFADNPSQFSVRPNSCDRRRRNFYL